MDAGKNVTLSGSQLILIPGGYGYLAVPKGFDRTTIQVIAANGDEPWVEWSSASKKGPIVGRLTTRKRG